MTNVKFVPARLEFARRRRGVPRTKLAALVDVSPKTVQRWESGTVEPPQQSLQNLADALRVLPSFFFSPEIDSLPEGAVSFRALSKMTAAERDGATAAGRLGVEFVRWLEGKFHLPANDVPTLTGWDPELAAETVRARWGLGTGIVRHLLPSCELHGVRVLSVAPDYRSVDAFSFYDNGTPFIFLDTSKTAERLRFDIAHELGHLVMHGEHERPHGKEAEAEANRFASAFLMPRDSILASGLFGATVDQIIRAKKKWHVAAMALAHRLNALGLLTEWGYRSVCVDLSKRGYRRSEPDSKLAHESSQILQKAMASLRDDNLTTKKIAAQFGLPSDELTAYLFGLAVTSQSGGGVAAPGPKRTPLHVVR
jgi:Zn-dependent peptidase ImmA (M78 family)/transcriptional regulator with XRE-family HTH domain